MFLEFNQMPILNLLGKSCSLERFYIIVTTPSSKLLLLYSRFMFPGLSVYWFIFYLPLFGVG